MAKCWARVVHPTLQHIVDKGRKPAPEMMVACGKKTCKKGLCATHLKEYTAYKKHRAETLTYKKSASPGVGSFTVIDELTPFNPEILEDLHGTEEAATGGDDRRAQGPGEAGPSAG